jgi:hypothetical protein
VVQEALGLALSPPTIPGPHRLGKLGHDLTVAELAHWLFTPDRRARGESWRTWRELGHEVAMARPEGHRYGGAGVGFLPDGALVLPAGERLAVEVELEDKVGTLAAKLRDYRVRLAAPSDAGGYEAVVWYCATAAMAARYAEAFRRAGCSPEAMWAEPLPPGLVVWR